MSKHVPGVSKHVPSASKHVPEWIMGSDSESYQVSRIQTGSKESDWDMSDSSDSDQMSRIQMSRIR